MARLHANDDKVAQARGPKQSAESPILFRSHGHETPLSDQNGASKIGDSVLWSEDSYKFNTELPTTAPNEDFGRLNKHFGPCFQSTFHIREYSLWSTDH
jgi:hypothetical protein